MNSSHAPQPGTVIGGKYRVERVLGTGGMGVVVAAHHIQLDQRIALKFLLPDAMKHPDIVERFAREARAAAKIRGEHVARVIDVGAFEGGAPYLVMEYLDGWDLARELEMKGKLPFESAVRYILEACEALAEAHAAKIVHRDLKPSNLFLAKQPDKRSIVKVLDFGISKVVDAPSGALTHTAALIGTAFYMSPEQLMTPKLVDHRSDIWSLGIILYELLGGQPPFVGETVPQIIGQILHNAPAPLHTLRADVPPGLAEVVMRCMSQRDDRYPSVAHLAKALAPFAALADRSSVDATSRVLEDVSPPSRQPPTTAAVITEQLDATLLLTPAPGSAPADTAAVPPPSIPTTLASQPAVTSHGLSTSSTISGVSPRSNVVGRVAIAMVGVAIAALIGVGALVVHSKKTTGNAGSSASTPVIVATTEPPASATTTATTEPSSTPPPETSAAPTDSVVVGATTPTTKATVAKPQPASPPTSTTVKASTTKPIASATPPASASAAKANPLNMGIK